MQKLSHYRRRRVVLSAVVAGLVIIPMVTFAVRKAMKVEDVSAVTYEMPSDYTAIVDAIFYDCVATEFVEEYPDEEIPATGLTDAQLAKITTLSCIGSLDDGEIADTTGIEKMTALTNFTARYHSFTTIDVSHNTELDYLYLRDNSLTDLDVSQNTKLKALIVGDNSLTTLDVSNNINLENLDVSNNNLTTLNISNNTELKDLDIEGNNFTELDVSHNTALTKLDVSDNNNLSNLNVSNNTNLENLDVSGNHLNNLDVSNNLGLTNLVVNNNALTTLDVSHNTALKELNVQNNSLTDIDVSNNMNLENLDVSFNNLTALNIPNNTMLRLLYASNNDLTTLDVSSNTALEELYVENNNLTNLDVSNNTQLHDLVVDNNGINALDISNNTELKNLLTDNILVRANFELTSMTPNIELSLAGLKFMDETTIFDTDNYTYDSENKIVSIKHLNGIDGYIQVGSGSGGSDSDGSDGDGSDSDGSGSDGSGSDGSDSGGDGSSFKLQVPNFVDFDINGGEGRPETQYCYPDFGVTECSMALPTARPTRNNYVFLGWAETAEATEATYQPEEVIGLTGSKTLHAVWFPMHVLTFDTNGGVGSIEEQACDPTTSVTLECSVTISATRPTRNNYVFLGWAETAEATEATYQPERAITLTGSKTLHAVWFPMHVLTFDTNGGVGSIEEQTCDPTTSATLECSVTIPTTQPTRSNYTFLGWAETAGAKEAAYQPGRVVTLNKSKTLYAVWNPVGGDNKNDSSGGNNGNNGGGSDKGSGGNSANNNSGAASGNNGGTSGGAVGASGATNNNSATSNDSRVTTPDTGRNTIIDEGGAMIVSYAPLIIVLGAIVGVGLYIKKAIKTN